MNLCKVTGQVISTQKDKGLDGAKMLICQNVRLSDMAPTSGYLVAVDSVGAGLGEMVIVVSGSSARIAVGFGEKPVDSTVIGIVDTVQIEGKIAYSKRGAGVGAAVD